MRIEATISDVRGRQIVRLAKELGLSRSQLVDEALALFLRAVIEAREGRRMASLDRQGNQAVREWVSPALSQIEWAAHREQIVLAEAGVEQIADLLARPPAPTRALRRAMEGKKRRS